MDITITKVRSGGQSGVDRAALDFARKHNMQICGWCPRASECPDGYRVAMEILEKVRELILEFNLIKKKIGQQLN